MAYIPPHKRHSKDTDKPLPSPSLLVPEFEKNLNLGPRSNRQRRKDQHSLQGGKIIYAEHSITRWWAIGLADDGHFPPSIRLENISCERIERKCGEKPVALVRVRPSTDANDITQSSEKSPWLYITKKIEMDLHSSFQNVRKEMEFEESKEIKPSFAVRLGKVFFHGSPVSLDTIWKSLSAENTRNQVKKSFNTNVPSAYMEAVQHLVVPRLGFDFQSEKEHYDIKVFDKSRPNATISCKCSITKNCGELELYKVELNAVRHFVTDISCLDKDLDLRLMLSTKRILEETTDEEAQSIREFVKSAIVDPDVKGGLRWPLGKESFGNRFCVVGVWHIKYKAFKGPTLTLKLRDADRFDFRTSTGEVSREITLKLKTTDIAALLRDNTVESGQFNEILCDALELIWDNFLGCDCSFT